MSDTAQPLSGHTEDLREIKRDVAAIRALLMEDNGSGETMAYTGTEDVLQPDGSGGFVTNRWTFIFGRFISKEPAL